MNGLEGIFEGHPFPVDLEHLMEGIRQIYSFEEWKIPIVENVDNFIDVKEYHTISFSTGNGILKIEMIGTGIPPETFKELPRIAFTTKLEELMREKKEGLGYFGWGLKATLLVAEKIEIETKYRNYRGRQIWYWVGRIPFYEVKEPVLELKEDQTVLVYNLKDEYKGILNENGVISTLQEFYPTLLAGAPALGRRRRFIVNGKAVPKPEWLDENKYRKIDRLEGLRVTGKSVGGRILISDSDLDESLRGIAIIVCGRNVTIERRLDLFPDVKRYSGYVHADVLFKDLIGDKTQIKKTNNPRFQELKKLLTVELEKVLRENGLLPKITIEDREFMRKVHKVIAEILHEIPELENYGIIGPMMAKANVYMKGDEILVTKEIAPSSKTDIPHKGLEKGIEQPGWGREEEPTISPSERGEEKARREVRKRRVLPEFRVTDLPDDSIEAQFEGGRVHVNSKHPAYQYARKTESARLYHVCRAGLEAILDQLLSNQEIDLNKYLDLKKRVMFTLGNVL